MMGLLPSFVTVNGSNPKTSTTGKNEWNVDFDTGYLTGRKTSGKRAVEVWIWKCLQTPRFIFGVYPWEYGSELESYIGRYLSQENIDTDVRLALEDALLINPDIISITNFKGTLQDDDLILNFTCNTKYGDVTVDDYDLKEYAERAKNLILQQIANGMPLFYEENGELHMNVYISFQKATNLKFYAKNGELRASDIRKNRTAKSQITLFAEDDQIKGRLNV